MSDSVLVVDDDDDLRVVLVALLRQAGYVVDEAPGVAVALACLARRRYGLLLSDVRMPDGGGMALLDTCRTRFPRMPVVLLTAHGDVPLAVDAVRRGARDFLLKPFERDALLDAVARALGEQATPAEGMDGIVGESDAFVESLALLDKVAGSERNLLLRGETGAGKELFARRAHARSARAVGPFVALNAAAIPSGLVERELFGHEAGAFSDAREAAPGAVERAEGGTLFLDEVGDLAPEAQAKLLRFLEARTYRRVGGVDERRADVRVVAATHHDLEAMIERGTFRADLYYRLDGFSVAVPPLRARSGDVRRLAEHFLAEAAADEGALVPTLDAGAWAALEAHPWPGNVRELRNVMQRLAIFADATVGASVVRGLMRPSEPPEPDAETTLASSRREMDRESILLALARAEGNKTAAARALGISRRSLYYKLRELGIG